ncbi:hypothetical protein [Sphingobacterium mizutaii]|uniref:hypothetical protein n=1 Tax=Sphingobacterium mizutaii TaxID=1010 RepID=UPI003D97F763
MEKEAGGKVGDFANKLTGIPYQVISRLYKPDPRSGKYPTPSTDLILEIINKFMSYNPTWLLTGDGEPFIDEEENYENEYFGYDKPRNEFEEIEYWRAQYIDVCKKYMSLQEQYTMLLKRKLKPIVDLGEDKSAI